MTVNVRATAQETWERLDAAKLDLLVTEHDAALKPALLDAIKTPDRWERRSLSARLSRHTVSVAPEVFAALATQPIGPLARWYELLPGQYHPVRGIDSRKRA